MTVTVAAALFIAMLSSVIVDARDEGATEGGSEEAKRALGSILSGPAFDAEGNLDLSKLPSLANRTKALIPPASGYLLTLDLLFDDRPPIDISRSGPVPNDVRQLVTEKVSVTVQTSSSVVSAGVLELYLWWP